MFNNHYLVAGTKFGYLGLKCPRLFILVEYLKPGQSSPTGNRGAGQDIGVEGPSDEEELPAPDPPPKLRQKTTARPAQEAENAGAALLEHVNDLPLFAGDYSTDMGMDHDGYHFNEHDRNINNNGKPRLVSGSLRTADLRVPKKHVLRPHEERVYLDGGLPPKYEELTVEQFVQGFLSTALSAPKEDLII
jgi:hypothetical protein